MTTPQFIIAAVALIVVATCLLLSALTLRDRNMLLMAGVLIGMAMTLTEVKLIESYLNSEPRRRQK